MLVDALQMLAITGFPIRDYQYTGMGSIYFVDFMLFHRLLGIKEMLSVEIDDKIEKRVDFNKPFKCVRTKIGPIGEVIPSLSRDMKHLLWLDYDEILTNSHLQDASLATAYLSTGSILLVTVDVEPPTETDSPEEWKQYFTTELNEYIDVTLEIKAFAKSELPQRNVESLIAKAISLDHWPNRRSNSYQCLISCIRTVIKCLQLEV